MHYISLDPSLRINTSLLKGDANASMGLITLSVQVGQHLVGQIRYIYHVI